MVPGFLLLALVHVMATFASFTTIDEPFTFSVATSPHYINSSLIFSASSNVIIENGAEIVFMGDYYLEFYGSVSCGCEDINTINDYIGHQRGLVDNSSFVYIHSGIKNSWGSYYNRGEIVVHHDPYVDPIDIRFCNTKFGQMRTAMRFSQNQLYDIKIDNCEFDHVLLVINNPFTASSQLGVTYITDSITTGTSNWFSTGGRTIYDNNDISGSYNHYNASVYSQVAIRNCKISGSLNSACVSFVAYEGDPTMAFYNNTVQHCGMGISLSDRDITMNNADEVYITGNTFANMEFNAINLVRSKANRIVITNNVFKDTESGRRETGGQSRMTGVIQTDDFNAGLIGKHDIVIQNNTFFNNNCSDPMINLKTTNFESSVAILHNTISNNAQWKGRIIVRGYDMVHIASNYLTNTVFTFDTRYKLSGYVDQKYPSPTYLNMSNNEFSDLKVYFYQTFSSNYITADISENVFHGRTDITFGKSLARVEFRCNNLYGLFYFSWRSSGECSRDLTLEANRNYFNGETTVIPTRDDMKSSSFGHSYCCACKQEINVTMGTVYAQPIVDFDSCDVSTLTTKPTSNPTQHPLPSLTLYPTANPSKDPSMDPSQYPTTNPSEFPSFSPSNHPSNTPTLGPSFYPTAYEQSKNTVNHSAQSTVLLTSNNSTHTKWVEDDRTKHQKGLLMIGLIVIVILVVIGVVGMIICVKKRKLKVQLLDEQNESMIKYAENKVTVIFDE